MASVDSREGFSALEHYAFGANDKDLVVAAFNLSPACIRALDGTIAVWCRGNERLYGWSRGEAIGRVSHELLQTTFPKPLAEIESELLAAGSWKGDLRQVTKWGQHLWVASHWTLQHGADAMKMAVVEVNDEITGHQCVDEMTRHLAQVVESSDDAIISQNVNGIVTSWNGGAERLFGYTAEEMVGTSILRLFPPELIREETEILNRLSRGERIAHYETVRLTKSGQRMTVSLTVSPLYDGNGRLIGASKIARDVSQRKALESALRDSEQRQRLAVEAGQIGLWSYDAQSGQSHWSSQSKEIFGLAPDDPAPAYKDMFRMIHSDDVAEVKKSFAQSFNEGTAFDNDFRVFAPSGGFRWVHSQGRPDFSPDGAVLRIHGAFLDTTERKQTEEELTRMNDQLQQFAYAAAHDLQEPLRNVALSVQLAQVRLHDQMDQQTAGLLETAVQNSHQMEAMVRDLLAYSRMFRDEEANEAVSDANEVMERALRNLATRINETAAEISYGDLPKVRMPGPHLLQVFQNLLDNSLKHRGTDPPCIQVNATCEQGMCEFSVADNGLGIEPQFQQRVFDVFKRLRKKETPGTGVGLALCKRTVEHYGGTIWIQSDGAAGTTFFFTVRRA